MPDGVIFNFDVETVDSFLISNHIDIDFQSDQQLEAGLQFQ
jgi:hypothetical protein